MSDKLKKPQTIDLSKPSLAKKREGGSTTNLFKKGDKKENSDDNASVSTTSNTTNTKDISNFSSGGSSGNVKVVCRVRPVNQREIESNGVVCVDFPDPKTIILKTGQYVDTGPGTHKFAFDRVFDMVSPQGDVYEFAAKPVVESVLEGFNGTVFAYGQTGSGKTHTMRGTSIEDPDKRGIIPRMVDTVFDYISQTPDHIEFTVKCSMVEIYMEKIRDLFSPEKSNLKIREDKTRGVYIEDVTEFYVSEDQDVYDLMRLGDSHRAISATNMNEGSSRSHMLFMMSIHQNNLHEMSAKTGKLYLVDLAGSEKVGKTGAAGQTLEEAKKINKSLSALGNVINALTDGKGHAHIPYRDSKLTRVLQESLGGNARTTLIITCSPSSFNDAETLSTLRFGYRAKSIKNTPKINREYTVAELQLLLEKAEKTIKEQERRIKQLEALLAQNSIAIPSEEELQPTNLIIEEAEKEESDGKAKSEGDSGDEGNSSEDEGPSKKSYPSLGLNVLNNDDQTRIKILESELEIERNNVRTQTEKVNILRKEFAFMNAKVITLEKENEALIHKLATLTLRMQEIEETHRQKEDNLEGLFALKETLIAENEELKRSKEQLLRILKEKDEEMERTERIQKFISPTKKGFDALTISPDKAQSDPTNDGIVFDLVKELSDKFGIKDRDSIKKIAATFISRVKGQSTESPTKVSGYKKKSEEQQIGTPELFKAELEQEKEKSAKLQEEYEKLVQEYDKLARKEIPDFDALREKIKTETIIKEREKHEKEKAIILRDLQKRVDKVVKLEMELDEEKEKNKNLETTMSEGEKALKKKVNTLENNLEQLTAMYHQLASQKSILKVDSQVTEKKLQRKTERILNLEKQLHETKELVNQYKNKIESLKSLISVSNSTNVLVSQIIPEGMDGLELGENSEGGSTKMQSPGHMRKTSSTNAKIVKHIRGGQTKKSLGGNTKLLNGILVRNSITPVPIVRQEDVYENNKENE